MTRIAQRLREHPSKNGIAFNILVTVVEIGGSIALFHLAREIGASEVVSYLIGSIGPVIAGFMIWAKARKFILIQAAGTAVIIRQTSYSTAYNYDQTLPLAATGLGIVGSIAIGRYFKTKGEARGVATNTLPPPPN
jgi:hypothetical protein